MIKVEYLQSGWGYKDIYGFKYELNENELLQEIRNNQELEKLYQTNCSYLAFSQG